MKKIRVEGSRDGVTRIEWYDASFLEFNGPMAAMVVIGVSMWNVLSAKSPVFSGLLQSKTRYQELDHERNSSKERERERREIKRGKVTSPEGRESSDLVSFGTYL